MSGPSGLHVVVRGRGPAVLFLHGLPTDGRLWRGVVARLAGRHTCVVVDLPGCGRSPEAAGGRLDPDAIVGALEAERRARGIPAWAVVGHDAGATVAAHYAARHAERVTGLVLLAPPLFPDLALPAAMRCLRLPVVGAVLAPVVAAALRRALPRLLRRPDAVARGTAASFAAAFRGRRGAQRLRRLARWGEPAVVLARTACLLPAIAAPTLVVAAAHDRIIGAQHARRAAAAIPGARLWRLDAGHLSPLDAPEALAQRVAAHVAGAAGPHAGPARYRTTSVRAATRARSAAASASGLSPHHLSAVS